MGLNPMILRQVRAFAVAVSPSEPPAVPRKRPPSLASATARAVSFSGGVRPFDNRTLNGRSPPLSGRSYSCSDLASERPATIGIGAKVVGHARYVAFQMAEVAISKNLFAEILRMIAELRPPPVASTA